MNINPVAVEQVKTRIKEIKAKAADKRLGEAYSGHMGVSAARPMEAEAEGMEKALKMLGLA